MTPPTSGHLLLLISLCCSMLQPMHALRILGIFPHPAISHFQFFRPIMRGLAEKGHDVTVLSYFPDTNPPSNYTDIQLTSAPILSNSVNLKNFETKPISQSLSSFFRLHESGKMTCNSTLHSDGLAQVLAQKERFDVVLMEQFNTDCMTAVAHQLKAPFIALSSCAMMAWHYDRMGMPFIVSSMPNIFTGLSESMTFGERVRNWFTHHIKNRLYNIYNIPAADALVRERFGHDMPSVGELAKKTSALFVNQHFSLSGVKPLPPSVIELGGIHIQKAKPLDAELQSFLDNADHGVVYISWGSMISANSLPSSKREAILRAIGRLKQRVLWKWENMTLEHKPHNLLVSKWLPQREILCHPNVKVFMSHGGLMGSTEAAYCGVPVVATPIFGDQFTNAAALRERGMGVILNYDDITEQSVLKSVREVLKKHYMDNAKSVSMSFKHRPKAALETAIWWVEYIARTKGAPLTKAKAVSLSRFIYHSMDIYLFFAFILSISVLSWWFICGNFYRFRHTKLEKEKTS